MRLLFSTTLIAASLTLAFPDAAPGQIGNPGGNPGQTSPFPGGGGRNGGQYPGGGRGGRGGGADRPGLPSKSRKNKNEPLPTVSTTGILRLLGTGASSDRFVLEADDHRIITFRTGDRTRVLKETKPVELSSFSKGDHLTVDATSDEEGNFTAVEIAFFSSGTPGDRAAASRTFDLPDLKSEAKADRPKPAGKAASSSDDDQRPVMRRPGDPPKSAAQPDEAQKSDAKQDASTGAAIATAADPDDTRPKTQMVPADAPADADDPGRPQLRRGGVSPRSAPGSAPGGAPAPASASTTASNRAPSAPPENSPLGGVTIESKVNGNSSENAAATSIIPVEEDPLIMKAKAAAADYTDTLPNYLVKQNTTRYDSDNPKNGWDAHDVVTADVTYKDGNQEYANVKVGNRSVKSIMDTGGQSSTGEFATWIEDIFSPTAAARFRRSGQETVNGRPCVAFKYEVTRERSHWRVSVGPQIYYPAYRGTVWIDRESSRVMRLEVESRGIPLLFPLEKVEMAMDYDFVRLASPRPFLLPTVAEVLSCQQGSTRCSRNRIEFRNYRKFGAESEITFEDKQ